MKKSFLKTIIISFAVMLGVFGFTKVESSFKPTVKRANLVYMATLDTNYGTTADWATGSSGDLTWTVPNTVTDDKVIWDVPANGVVSFSLKVPDSEKGSIAKLRYVSFNSINIDPNGVFKAKILADGVDATWSSTYIKDPSSNLIRFSVKTYMRCEYYNANVMTFCLTNISGKATQLPLVKRMRLVFFSDDNSNEAKTITLNKNGGTGGTDSITACSDINPYKITPPTRTGYNFLGYYFNGSEQWYDANGNPTISQFGDNLPSSLTANWEQKLTVTLDRDGGTGGTSSVTVNKGDTMPSITKPTRTGYTFNGYWTEKGGKGTKYYNADGSSAKKYDKNTGITLYAAWTANSFTVTFNKNNGTGGTNSVTATYGNNMPSATMPTRTGYTFQGYYDATSGGTQYYTATGASARTFNKTANTTLYARWSAKVYNNIVLDAKGGSGGTTKISATYDSNMPSATMPTRVGCVFQGYYSGENGTGTKYYNADGTSARKWNIDNDSITLYAYWTYNSDIQGVIDKINAIGGRNNVKYPDSKSAINDAENAYYALIAAHPEYEDILADKYEELDYDRAEYNLLRLEAIDDVNHMINNMLDNDGNVDVTYPDSHDDLYGAENGFNALDPEDQTSENIPNMGKLVDCRNEYDSQIGDAVDAVIDAINNIFRDSDGNIVYIDSKESLVAAEELYDALAPEEKAPSTAVSNYADLVQARTDYNALISDRTSQVINAINNISKPFDENYKFQLETANELYDSLDETEKNSAYITNLQILNDANAASDVVDMIEALRDYENFESQQAFIDAVDAALDAYIALSFEQKSYLNDSQRTLLSGMDGAAIIIRGIDKMGNVVTYDNNDQDSKADIDFYQDLYDQLPDELFKDVVDHFNKNILDHNAEVYNNVDSVAILIRALTPAEDQAYYDAVDAAKAAYDALTDEEKAVIDAATDFDYEKSLADNVAAKDVIERIDDIDSVTYDNGIEDSLADIAYAEEGYNALTDDQKAIVDAINHAILTHDREVYDNVDNAGDLIRALTPAEDQAYYDAVDAAKAAYDALTNEEKNILNASVDFDYDKTLVDNVAAKEVIKRIDDIDDVTYDGGENDSLADITYAEEGYNDLTDDQKAIVDSVNHDTLTHDREVYDNVEEVASLIEAIPLPAEDQAYYDAVDAAKTAYDALTDEEKAIIDAAVNFDYEKVLTDNVAAKDVIKRIDDIDDVTYDGGKNDSLADITYAEEGYEALTDEQKAIVDSVNHDTLTHDREVYDNVDEVADLIRDLTPAEDQEYYDAVDDAKAAYDALTDEEKGVIDAALDLDYEKSLDDNLEAKDVIILIQDIGKVTYNGGEDDSLEDIINAENGYDALTPDQQAIVDAVNHDTLKQDRESYDKVDEAVNLIQDIGEVNYGGDEDSQEAIQAAREAFNALGEEEQALVEGYQESYKKLEDDEHVYSAMEYIDNIDKVEYDTRSEEAINDAREYYDSLTDDQKAQLGDKALNSLTNAEKQYADIQNGSNAFVTAFLIISSLTLIGGLFVLFLLLFKRRKDDDENKENKTVKTYSFVGLLPLVVLASHYVDAPFMALYIITGLALLVWIANLVFFILKINNKLPTFNLPLMKKKTPVAEAVAATPTTNEEETPAQAIVAADSATLSTPVYIDPTIMIDGPVAEKKVAKPRKVEVEEPVEDETDDEVKIVTDSSGNTFQIRYVKSFTAKLSQASDELKDYYNELKNYILSYKKTSSRVSWHYDSINNGRNNILRFAIRGKTLCLFFAVDPAKYEGSKYKVERFESRRFANFSCLYRIKNNLRLKYSKEMIDEIMKSLNLEKGNEFNDEYRIPYEDNSRLLAKGLIKELKLKLNKPINDDEKNEEIHSIDVKHADEMMSDDKAEEVIEEDVLHKRRQGSKEIINIDTLSQNYNDGDTVDLDSLIAKKLVPGKTGYVKVLARGVLDKKLIVDLDDFSLQAVKMIVLLGGHAKKIRN